MSESLQGINNPSGMGDRSIVVRRSIRPAFLRRSWLCATEVKLLLIVAFVFLFVFARPTLGQRPFSVDPNDPDQFNCAVSGRVVDDEHEPVDDAKLVLDDSHQVFYFNSDASGRFLLKSHCVSASVHRILFVTTSFDLSGIVPVDPLGYRFSGLGTAFAGQPVTLAENTETQIGDVRVQAYYSKAAIEILDRKGNPFFGPETDRRLLLVRVLDDSGRVVAETGLSEIQSEGLAPLGSVIPMYLPDGRWRIEINLDEDHGAWFTSDTFVEIPRTNSPVKASLKMFRTSKAENVK